MASPKKAAGTRAKMTLRWVWVGAFLFLTASAATLWMLRANTDGPRLRVPQDAPTLAEAVAQATPGLTIILDAAQGPYQGPFVIDHPQVRLTSANGRARLMADALAPALSVRADGVRIEGLQLEGARCLEATGAAEVVIERNTFAQCETGALLSDTPDLVVLDNAFADGETGLWLERVAGATVRGNRFERQQIVAVLAQGLSGAIISGNTLLDNYLGIKLEDAHDNRFSDNSFRQSENEGLLLSASHHNTVENNRFIANYNGVLVEQGSEENVLQNNRFEIQQRAGIYIAQSNRNVVRANTAQGNALGIYLLGAEQSLVELNIAQENAEVGIALRGGGHNTVRDNQVSNSPRGIDLNGANDNLLLDNAATGNQAGVLLNTAQGNTVQGNRLTGNQTGLEMHFSKSNLVKENTVSGQAAGLLISESSVNTFVSNLISGNRFGVNLLYATGNVLRDNLIQDNEQAGLSLVNFSSDNAVSKNKVTGNGWGVLLSSSAGNALDFNTLQDNTVGLVLNRSGPGTQVKGNDIVSNRLGIHLPEFVTKEDTFLADTPVILEAAGSDEDYLIRDNTIADNGKVGLANDKDTRVFATDNHWSQGQQAGGNGVTGLVELTLPRHRGPLFIASQDTALHRLLGTVLRLALQDRGFAVVDMTNLGPAHALTSALQANIVDVAWLDSGEALERFGPDLAGLENTFEAVAAFVRERDAQASGLRWLTCAPADISLALAYSLSSESAGLDHGLNLAASAPDTMVQLASVLAETDATPILALPQAFEDAPSGGWEALVAAYGIAKQRLHLKPTALEEAAIDLSVGNTDLAVISNAAPEIELLNLSILADPLNVFWHASLCPVVRQEVAEQFPEVVEVLEKIAEGLTLGQLRTMGSKVVYLGESPESVARQFLERLGGSPQR